MSIHNQLWRLGSLLSDLAEIDFGYPLGENLIIPPISGAAAALSEAGLSGISGVSDLYSACDGIKMPDVYNGYFVYDSERVCSQYPDSDPHAITSADGSQMEVLTIGQDGGGNHFVVDRASGWVMFLPLGPLSGGNYDARLTDIRVIAESITSFLGKILDDVSAFVNDDREHCYLTDK